MIARVRVLDSRPETPTSHTVRFTKPEGFSFRPVQFVGLELDTDEGRVEYSMSLACSPTRPYLEFGARLTDTAWKRAFRDLVPGAAAEIDGPYGDFVLDETRPAVLLAGGIGITPLKGMMQYAADRRLDVPVTLVYSNRTPEEIAYRGDVEDLARSHARIRVVHTITRPDGARWEGRVGRIDEALVREAAGGRADAVYYLCGTPGMVEFLVQLLRGMGVPRGSVRYEAFWGYE